MEGNLAWGFFSRINVLLHPILDAMFVGLI
jgi:hypothetical protein